MGTNMGGIFPENFQKILQVFHVVSVAIWVGDMGCDGEYGQCVG